MIIALAVFRLPPANLKPILFTSDLIRFSNISPFLNPLLLAMVLASCGREAPVPAGDEVHRVAPSFTSAPGVDPFAGVDAPQIQAIVERMTLEEKIGQLIIWTPDLTRADVRAGAAEIIKPGRAGGLLPRPMPVEDYLFWKDSLERSATIPLLTGTQQQVSLHGQFSGCVQFPRRVSIAAIDSAAIRQFLAKEYFKQCRALGIHFSFRAALPPVGSASPAGCAGTESERCEKDLARLAANDLLAFANNFSSDYIQPNDSVRLARLQEVYRITSNGLPGIFLNEDIFADEKIRKAPFGFIKQYLSEKMGFRGLTMARLLEGESPELKLLQGTDLFLTPDVDYFHLYAIALVQQGLLSEKELDRRVRRILSAKAWIHGGRLPVQLSSPQAGPVARLVTLTEKKSPRIARPRSSRKAGFEQRSAQLSDYFNAPAWKYYVKGLFEKSVICAGDANKLLPFTDLLQQDFRIVELGDSNFKKFKYYFSKYANFTPVRLPKTKEGHLPVVRVDNPWGRPVVIVLLDSLSVSPKFDRAFIEGLNTVSRTVNVVLVNFGDPANLALFENTITFLQIFERNDWTEAYAAQALFGGVSTYGQLPVAVSATLPVGSSVKIHKQRLRFGGPEAAGIAPERLVGIDAIARTAIQKRVFPGCQVAVVKDGNVVYSKAFGYHTYAKDRPVSTTDLYDIASVSKIAATTLAIMKLQEQNSLSITGKLQDYIQLPPDATVGRIPLKNLLIHSSGLQAPMPISRFYNYRSVPASGCNDIFCRSKNSEFSIPVTSSLFFRKDYRDTILDRVVHLPLKRRRFKYSDVNFYLLQKVVEELARSPLEKFLSKHLYQPLGLRHLAFNPTKKFDRKRIVPTERDNIWRKELVWGYVHDPAAALMGGVGGNAGIFANAEDMAVLFEVLANNGEYGGIQYFDPKTIHTFTTAKYGNYRALGFDKPIRRKYPTYSRKTPPSAYGHTGFTGTCVWVDPDNHLVFIFLSNRIHPSASNKKIFLENVRSRIHDVVYSAFGSLPTELPALISD